MSLLIFSLCVMCVTIKTLLLLLLLSLFSVVAKSSALAYDVHWLSGPTVIERDVPAPEQKVAIYCYNGTPKNVLSLWQTVKFHIKMKTDEFSQYIGESPDEVFKEYTEDTHGWTVVNPIQQRMQRTMSVSLFTPTCMAVHTKERHSVELQVIRVDLWRVVLMSAGLVLMLSSRRLSRNPVFFYLCGIFIGVFASFMILVYYVSKLLPRKTLTYGLLIGGWTVGVYLLQQVWDNILSIVRTHQTAAFWYTCCAGFVSFLACYRIGPPRNPRSRNLVMWTLQAVGVLMTFFSSEYQEAVAALVVATLAVNYFPKSLRNRIAGYWRRRFPPKLRYLTNEEYYEQGARETKHSLDSLRQYCSSPDCAQWSIMLKLNDSKRFATFVEGNSHLSDDEILDYESYVFSMERKKRLNASTPASPRSARASPAVTARASPGARRQLEISDDKDSTTDDDL